MNMTALAETSVTRPFISGWQKLLIGLILLLALAGPYVGGLWAAYPLIFITVFLALKALVQRVNVWRLPDRTNLFFLGGFGLLVVAFVATARQPSDVIYIGNFLMFAFYAPVAWNLSISAMPRNGRTVAVFAFVGTVLASLLASYQVFVAGAERAAGRGSDPIWSAEAAVLLGFVALLGFSRFRGVARIPFLVAPAIGIFVAILSGSRGPLFAVPLLVIAYVIFDTIHWLRNLILGLVAAAIFIGAILLVVPDTNKRFESLVKSLPEVADGGSVVDQSISQRRLMYQAGGDAFMASPWIGHGWAGKMDAIVPYLPPKLSKLPETHHHLHNDGLDFAVSGGVLGILAYLLVLFAPIAGAVTSQRDSQYRFRLTASVMLGGGYAIFGLTYLLFGYEFHTTLYVILSAIIVAYCRDEPMAAVLRKKTAATA
ncbi:MAG TPA: O-antigen ligase family protein [Devosiaceae bacterium]|jgi:O-antigen ligase